MIRLATPADWPALKALLLDTGLAVDGMAYEAFSQPCLVYVRDGEVVAFVQAHVGHPYAVITEVAVARDHQRKGYAIRLTEHMETLLRAAGCTAWVTFAGDKRAAVAAQIEGVGGRCLGAGTAWVKAL